MDKISSLMTRTHLECVQLLKLPKYEVNHWQESIFCKIIVLSLINHFYKSFKMCVFKIWHTKSGCFVDKYVHWCIISSQHLISFLYVS